MPSFVVNGALTLSGDPTAPNQVATKGYVDSKVTNMDASHVGGVAPLAGARMPALSGDLIANQGNTTLTLAPTGVVAGSYTKVRTDANGRIVEGVSTVVDDYSAYISFTNILPVSRPNSLAGYGITEAVRTDGTTMTGVLSLGSSSFAATELVTKGYVDASRDTALYGKTISAGDIFIRPSTIAPTGYLRCNGGLVSKMAYPDLYAVIGDGSPVQLSDYGSGRPWQQQYNINNTQIADIGSWSAVTAPFSSTNDVSVFVTKNKVYACGGVYYGGAGGASTDTVRVANINADGTIGVWSNAGVLPRMTAGASAVVMNNYVYLIGGYNYTVGSGTSYYSSYVRAPINVDGTIGAWVLAGSFPISTTDTPVAIGIKNKIYLLGGHGTTIYTATVSVSGDIGSWTASTVSMPNPNPGPSGLLVCKNRLYIIGGSAPGVPFASSVYSSVIATDGTLGAWSIGTDIPVGINPIIGFYVTTGRIFIIGGRVSGGGTTAIYTAVVNSDGTFGTWTTSSSVLPAAIITSGFFATSNYLYFINGYNMTSGQYSSAGYMTPISGGLNDYSPYYAVPVENVYNTGKPWQQHYDQNTDQVSGISSWTAGTSLPAAIKNAQAVVTKDRVYLIGGTNGTTTLTSVYTASVAADGTLGAWSAATSLPVATANAQVCTTMDRIYLIGGDNGTTQSNKVYCAVIAADGTISSWTESAVLPETFSRGQVLATYRRVYIFAGLFNGVRGTQSYYSDIAADGTLGAWVAGGALPVSVADARLVCTKRIAYLIGGTTAAGNANTYCKVGIQPDGSLGTWTKLTTDVTTNLFGVNSGALPTNVTTLRITGKGGDGGAGTTVNLTGSGAGTITAGVTSVAITGRGADGTIGATSGGYAFTPGTTGTVQIPPNCSIVAVGGKGEDGSGYFNSDLSSTGGKPWLNQYDINTLQSGTEFTFVNADSGFPALINNDGRRVLVTKNKVYLFPSSNNTTTYVADIDTNGNLSAWVAVPANVQPNRYNSYLILTKNTVYLVGGVAGTPNTTVGGFNLGPVTTAIKATINADGTISSWSEYASAALPSINTNGYVHVTKTKVYIFYGRNQWGQSHTEILQASKFASGDIAGWSPTPGYSGFYGAEYRGYSVANRLVLQSRIGGSDLDLNGDIRGYSFDSDGVLTGYYNVHGTAMPVDNTHSGSFFVTRNVIYYITSGQTVKSLSVYGILNSPTAHHTWTESSNSVITNKTAYGSYPETIIVTKGYVYLVGGEYYAVGSSGCIRASINSDISDYSPYYDGVTYTVTSSGASATFTYDGVTYTAPGGVGVPATTQSWSLPATTSTYKPLTFNVPANGTGIFQYIETTYTAGANTAITVDGQPYTFSGGNGQTPAVQTTQNITLPGAYGHEISHGRPWQQQYNINTEQAIGITNWTSGTALPVSLKLSQAVVTKNRVYLLGGANSSSMPINTVYTAPINSDGTLGTWTTGASLLYDASDSQIVVTKNRIYLLGGCRYGQGFAETSYAAINADGTLSGWTLSNALPEALGGSQAIVIKNRVYLLGGIDGSGNRRATVYTAPIDSSGVIGTWITAAPLPNNVSVSQAVVTKNRVYLLGGDVIAGDSSAVWTSAINADGTLGAWTAGSPLPSGIRSTQVLVTKNTVYLMGGWSGGYSSAVYTASINPDGTLGTWTWSESLPFGLGRSQVVTTKNRVYLLGGQTVNSPTDNVYTAAISGGLNDYSPYYDGTQFLVPHDYTYSVPTGGALGLSYQVTTTSTNTLTGNGSINLPVTTTTVAMTAKGEDGYKVPSVHIGSGKPWEQQALMTGSNNSGNITGWTVDHGGFPGNGSRTACAVTKNKVYIIGGNNGSSAMSAIYRANIVAGVVDVSSWSVIANLPFGVYDHEVVVTHNRIHVIGGVSSGVGSSAIYSAVIDSNGNIGSWSQTGSLPAARCRFGVAITKNRIYVIGSDDGTVNPTLNGVYTATVNADGSFGTWTSAPNLVYGVINPAIAVTANRLYVIGGVLSSGFTAAYVQYAVISADGTIGAWITATSLPQGCAGGATYVSSNEIYYQTSVAANGQYGLVYRAPLVSEEISSWIQGTQSGGTNGVEALFAVANKLYILTNNPGYNHSLSYATITGGSNDYSPYYDGVTYADNITGTSSTITLNGVTYTFPGGVGIPAVSSTQNATLPGVSSLAMSYSMAPGVTASTSYSYVASGNGAATTVTVNGTTYTFAGGVGAPATETTQLVTIPNTGPAYSHNVPTYGYARFEYTTVSEGSLLPEPLSDFQTYTTANTAYIFGGKTNTAQTATYTASIDYNGRLSAWTASTALPVATYAADLIAVKNKLYILGGANTTGATPVVHYATILGGKNDYSGAYSTAQYTMYSSDFRLPDFSTIETTGSYYYIKT